MPIKSTQEFTNKAAIQVLRASFWNGQQCTIDVLSSCTAFKKVMRNLVIVCLSAGNGILKSSVVVASDLPCSHNLGHLSINVNLKRFQNDNKNLEYITNVIHPKISQNEFDMFKKHSGGPVLCHGADK